MTETWAFGQTLPRSRSFWQFYEDKDEITFFISSLKPFGLAHMLSQTFPLQILTSTLSGWGPGWEASERRQTRYPFSSCTSVWGDACAQLEHVTERWAGRYNETSGEVLDPEKRCGSTLTYAYFVSFIFLCRCIFFLICATNFCNNRWWLSPIFLWAVYGHFILAIALAVQCRRD